MAVAGALALVLLAAATWAAALASQAPQQQWGGGLPWWQKIMLQRLKTSMAEYCSGTYDVLAKTNLTFWSGNISSYSFYEREKFKDVTSRCYSARSDEAFNSSLALVARMLSGYSRSLLPGEAPDTCGLLGRLRRLRLSRGSDIRDFLCRVTQGALDSRPGQWLEDMKWDWNLLHKSHQRRELLNKLLFNNGQLLKAAVSNKECKIWRSFTGGYKIIPGPAADDFFYKHAQLVATAVESFERSLAVLLIEQQVKNISEQQMTIVIKQVKRLVDMLHVYTSGWAIDIQDMIHETHYIQLDKNDRYEIRLSLLNDRLLPYDETTLELREEFAERCEGRVPGATAMLQVADTLYSFLHYNWFRRVPTLSGVFSDYNVTREEWDLEDLSERQVTVDGGCVQLLVDLLEHPGCPLEDTPEERDRERQRCRSQLSRDLMLNVSYIPITSYLAYTQRVSINICLFSWMVTSPKSICQDVPHRRLKSVSEAHCLFSRSQDTSCRPNNTADVVCHVSRAVFRSKCKNFYADSKEPYCYYHYSVNKNLLHPSFNTRSEEKHVSNRLVTRTEALYSATIKYRNFKIDHLQALEVSLITINVFFRCLTASVFLYLPKFGNLPGKLLLCFQMTGLAQIVCSEVLHRIFGVPDLATAAQLDGALTLLSCLWLNAFCYQAFSGILRLRLPDHLDRYEASRIFRSYVKSALLAWAVVSAVFVSLERVSDQYLLHSRALLLAAIALSVAGNFLLLLIITAMYVRTRQSMSILKVITDNKLGSKKQLFFLTAKTVLLSGLGILVRVGFHQAAGLAWLVYCVHLATMLQGPAIFVLFVCNGTALPQLRHRLQRWRNPDVITSGDDLCSTARENLNRRNKKPDVDIVMETTRSSHSLPTVLQ